VHLVGFIVKKFVTMYGHMNVKKKKKKKICRTVTKRSTTIQAVRTVGTTVEYMCRAKVVVTPFFTGGHVQHITQSVI
jgi:ribosomal protein S3AE